MTTEVILWLPKVWSPICQTINRKLTSFTSCHTFLSHSPNRSLRLLRFKVSVNRNDLTLPMGVSFSSQTHQKVPQLGVVPLTYPRALRLELIRSTACGFGLIWLWLDHQNVCVHVCEWMCVYVCLCLCECGINVSMSRTMRGSVWAPLARNTPWGQSQQAVKEAGWDEGTRLQGCRSLSFL